MSDAYTHIPVLAESVVEFLSGSVNGHPERILDGTLGCGGHSALLLKALPEAELVGIDRDDAALARAGETLVFASKRIHLVRNCFSRLTEAAHSAGWDKADAILLDIGVSSPQIDDPERGFSFRTDGPLDMRMDRTSPLTAARILNQYSAEELQKIFEEFGELKHTDAFRLARETILHREKSPFTRTNEFALLCENVLSPKRGGRTLPAPTLPFQALRIAVNDELGELKRALEQIPDLLNPGGRVCVISFHSLEDRIVKNFFREMAETCKCPPGLPVCVCGWKPKLKILTKHPVEAGEEELSRNRRAACAKLRAAEKIS